MPDVEQLSELKPASAPKNKRGIRHRLMPRFSLTLLTKTKRAGLRSAPLFLFRLSRGSYAAPSGFIVPVSLKRTCQLNASSSSMGVWPPTFFLARLK